MLKIQTICTYSDVIFLVFLHQNHALCTLIFHIIFWLIFWWIFGPNLGLQFRCFGSFWAPFRHPFLPNATWLLFDRFWDRFCLTFGSHFARLGTLLAALGSILDLFGSFWEPFWQLWGAFRSPNVPRATCNAPRPTCNAPFSSFSTFRQHTR